MSAAFNAMMEAETKESVIELFLAQRDEIARLKRRVEKLSNAITVRHGSGSSSSIEDVDLILIDGVEIAYVLLRDLVRADGSRFLTFTRVGADRVNVESFDRRAYELTPKCASSDAHVRAAAE